MRKFTITVDYGATGEGRTLIIYYVMAQDREEALLRFKQVINGGDWYAIGAEVKEGFDLDGEIARSLVPSAVRNVLGDDQCHRSYLAELHYNYS